MSLGAAFKAFFAILGSSEKATLWKQAESGELVQSSELETQKSAVESAKNDLKKSETAKAELQKSLEELQNSQSDDRSDAVYTLTLLQREGRLVDFLQEDISSYTDDQVGGAVRQIHEGCSKVLKRYFKVEALNNTGEGEQVTVPAGFDAAEFSLSGAVSGEAPYTGSLIHKGWKVSALDLPERSAKMNGMIICPAEVEV